MQLFKSVSENPLIAAFQVSSASSLNLGQSQNGVLGNGLKLLKNDKILALSKLKAFCRRENKWGSKLQSCYGRIENIVGKRENAGPTMFSTLPKPNSNVSFTFILSSANAFNLD